MLKVWLLFLTSCAVIEAMGQQWELIRSLPLKEPVTALSVDQAGTIYLGTEKGNLLRYDHSLAEEVLFSEINLSPVTAVEAWNRLKIFLFFRENQKILLLDRFATQPKELFDGGAFDGFMQMAAPGMDNSYWILESRTNELRKYNQETLLLSTPITNSRIKLQNITCMQTYQNLVILLDRKNGFYFFDQYGNFLSNKAIPDLQFFQISDGKVVSFDGSRIITFDPFTPSGESSLIPPPGTYSGAFRLADNQYVFLERDRLSLFQLFP